MIQAVDDNESTVWLTTSETARRIGWSPDSVRRACEDGHTFPGAVRLRKGGQWRIPEQDVEAFKAAVRPVVRRSRSA